MGNEYPVGLGGDHPFGLEPQPLASPPGTARKVMIAVLAVIAGSAMVAGISVALRDEKPPKAEPPPAVAQDVSCRPIVDVPPDVEPAHRTGDIPYDELPPSSGDHNPMPLPALPRVVGPESELAVERAVHNLEHGYVVVWYDPDVTRPDDVAAALDGVRERKVIAVPWDRGGMGEARPYVLAAWGHRQDCTGLSAGAVQAFFAEHGGANGDAPEKAAP